MEILFFVLPIALIISIIFLICFVYSVNTGQYDDLDTPAYRMLINDEAINDNKKNNDEGSL